MDLPAMSWKLINNQKLISINPKKHIRAVESLIKI